MSCTNSRGLGLFASAFVLILVAGCSNHRANTASHAGTPSPTPFLGIDSMAKGYIPSVSKKALVVVLLYNPGGGSSSEQATRVFDGIKGMLEKSDLDVAVIKVPVAQGMFHETASFVYVRDSRGEWGHLEDKALLQAVIRAGL